MSNESQSTEKTEQELFEEVSAALASGEDIGNVIKDVEITGPGKGTETPKDDDTPPPEEPVVELKEEGKKEEETPPVQKKEEVAPTADDEEAFLAALPPEVQERFKKLKDERTQLEHRVKSELGRVPALQRRVEELSRKLSAPPAPAKKQEAPAATPTSVAKSKFAEKIAQVQKIDPDLAEVLLALKEEVDPETLRRELADKVGQTQALIKEKEEQEAWSREKNRLLQMIPQADDVFRDPRWRQWKNEQSEGIRALASSMDADDMVLALQKFAADMQARHPDQFAPPAQQTPPTPAPNPTAAKVVQDRARKLAAGAPNTQGTPPKQGSGLPAEGDDDAWFNYVVTKIQKGESLKF